MNASIPTTIIGSTGVSAQHQTPKCGAVALLSPLIYNPEEGQTATGYIAVHADTVYTDGQYGWLTESEREGFKNESKVSQPYADSIWATEDGVFRVALPNGTYEVTCYFSANDSEPLEINLIAGREHQIQRLRIPAGNETVGRRYNITVTDEHLTQVIYTRGKGNTKGGVGAVLLFNQPMADRTF